MNILFLHKGFPGQYKFIVAGLANNPENKIFFITNSEKGQIKGVNKLVYKLAPKSSKIEVPFLDNFDEATRHGQAAANVATQLKNQGFKPDIILGHSGWGCSMFIKDVFPDVPLMCYFEWYENAEGAALGFDGNLPDENRRVQTRGSNAHRLIDLYSCDAGISPTEWQKSQFPKEFQSKIKVIHDGVSSISCKPDKDAKFIVKDKNLELTVNDEVITYATRGMEPYRGFPQFMEAVEKLQKKRPNAHFVIGGLEQVFYGNYLKEGTYKDIMLKKLNLDMDRVHFVGELQFAEYINLLQISSVHVYATVPFVLSWSFLEAMSVGCCIVASNTPPVLEMMQDNYNGLLYDFYNVEMMVEKIEYALDNPKEMDVIRNNARQFVIDNYDIMKIYPKHLEYINSLIKN